MSSEQNPRGNRVANRLARSARYRLNRAKLTMAGQVQTGMRYILRHVPGALDDDLLYAVYDLNVMPTSYDVVWFLTAAEIERRKRGLMGIHVVISLFDRPFVHAMPVGHEDHVTENDMLWRVANIVAPCCGLLPTCISHSVMPSTMASNRLLSNVKHVWPADWSSPSKRTTLPQIYNLSVSGLVTEKIGGPLRAPAQGLDYVREWARQTSGDRDLIVITVREHQGGPARNSDLPSWIAFADTLDQSRFHAVFVPDTLHALTSTSAHYGNHTVFRSVAHNMGLRLALYEHAYLNLFVSNGPASTCILDNACRYLLFKISVPQVSMTSYNFLAQLGFEAGSTPLFSEEFQKWIWENDELSIIQREFAAMSETIDAKKTSPEDAWA